MRAGNYREVKGQAYTRKKYVRGFPPPKINKFTMGDTKGTFTYEAKLIALKSAQIRHNALEAARIATNRLAQKKLVNKYLLNIYPYPHMILRENKMIFGAHADRLQDGMLEDMLGFGMLSGRGWIWVLGTNLRALLLTALLGVFSVGVIATILLTVPIGIIGYSAGNIMLAGQNVGLFLTALVLPHAVLEIPASLLAGGSILHLGATLISPPKNKSLGESWLQALAEWARINFGLVVPLLAAAAALEVFLTPVIALRLLTGG